MRLPTWRGNSKRSVAHAILSHYAVYLYLYMYRCGRTHWVTLRMFSFFFFFSFAGDYTGRPVVVMNETVLRRSPMVPYSLLFIVVASGQKTLPTR